MQTLLIKISGELFSDSEQIKSVITQTKTLCLKHKVGIVVGGGNFFRGSKDGGRIGLQKSSAHEIGMLSTIVNGIVLKDFLLQESVSCQILSAFSCPEIASSINQNSIKNSFEENNCVIFVGGTGNPFFTTDTNAVLRAIQIGAKQVWKGTKVDGVYESDPLIEKNSKFYSEISYSQVLEKGLKVIDKTAVTLAQENEIEIRVFNIFEKNALLKAQKDPGFGSTIR